MRNTFTTIQRYTDKEREGSLFGQSECELILNRSGSRTISCRTTGIGVPKTKSLRLLPGTIKRNDHTGVHYDYDNRSLEGNSWHLDSRVTCRTKIYVLESHILQNTNHLSCFSMSGRKIGLNKDGDVSPKVYVRPFVIFIRNRISNLLRVSRYDDTRVPPVSPVLNLDLPDPKFRVGTVTTRRHRYRP